MKAPARRIVFAAVAVATLAGASALGLAAFAGDGGAAEALTYSQTGSVEGALAARDLLASLEAQGHNVTRDTDQDGLADALENFLYGTDAHAFSTTGNGIPDGWFARHGYDPSRPGIELEPAAEPAAHRLPPAYEGSWPDRYRWTLDAVYGAGRPAGHPDNTTWDNGLDPRQAFGPGGIPFAWAHHHGLSLTQDVSQQSLNGAGTVLEAFQHDTDPRKADTDGDGLSDRDEVVRYGTDPRLESTTGGGVPDGWLVRHGLDPLDRTLPSSDPQGKGLSVRDTWRYNLQRFGRAAALAGDGLNPTLASERADGVPDGWLVRYGLDPLNASAAAKALGCASTFAGVRDLVAASGQPALPDLCLTVADAYEHARPADWDPKQHGPWLGGLDPRTTDQDSDGLPDAVELRGWHLRRYLDPGPSTPAWSHVASDPQRPDTDQDGLRDGEEYAGAIVRGALTTLFSPSDPSNPDTAFSGIGDADKVAGNVSGVELDLFAPAGAGARRALLDPARFDSSGGYLSDAEAVRHWTAASEDAADCKPYTESYPGSAHAAFGDWINELPWVKDAGLTLDCAQQGAALAPDGDIDHDAVPNAVDADPATPQSVLVPAGWKLDPAQLRFGDFPLIAGRSPIDPANPDTDGDGLPDGWELRHGQPSAAGGSDLDPAAANSDLSQALPDGERNLNGDVVRWTAFGLAGGVPTPQPCTYSFTNLDKYRAGADPHKLDERGVGASSGWVHFWSNQYPTLVQLTTAGATDLCTKSVGLLVPDLATSANKALKQAIGDGQTDLRTVEVGRLEYLRFETEEPGIPFAPPDPNPNREDDTARTGPLRVDNRDVFIRTVKGTFELTLPRVAAAGLNPYLADSDGDHLPDVWEMHYGPGCQFGPDALARDAAADPDLDALSNLDEHMLIAQFGHGTDPCLRDTRGDGLDDGMVAALGDPTQPGSAIDSADPNNDGDGDGVPDRTELQRRTDPRRPDTAFSGLLDGDESCRDLEELGPGGLPRADAVTRDLLERGIAHHARDPDDCAIYGTQHIAFRGSVGQGRDARVQRANADNAPATDGWIVHHGGNPLLDLSATQLGAYACGRPTTGGPAGSWWDETRLGTWWWGQRLQPQGACPRDQDRDGLEDGNGEDPVPAASQSNNPPTPPGVLQAAIGGDVGAVPLLKLAQGFGECAGDPEPCQTVWAAQAPGLLARRVPAALANVQVAKADGSPLPDGVLPKETPFRVTGRLVADCGLEACGAEPVGLSNRTIVLRSAAPQSGQAPSAAAQRAYAPQDGSVIGVAFTGADGTFAVPACLCKAPASASIPMVNVTALGHLRRGPGDAEVTWTPAAAAAPVGAARHLVLHAYATPATGAGAPALGAATPLQALPANHPQALGLAKGCDADLCVASQAASVALGARAVSTPTTALTLTVPASVTWTEATRRFTVSASLVDASGGPLEGRSLAITFAPPIPGVDLSAVTTNSNGAVSREISMPPGANPLVGPVDVSVSYAGVPGAPAAASPPAVRTVLQAPVTLTLAPPGQANLGLPFVARVQVKSLGEPLTGHPVIGSLGKVPLSGVTDAEGWVELETTLNGTAPGTHDLVVRSAATPAFAAAQARTTVDVRTGSELQATLPRTVPAGGALRVVGTLRSGGDEPLTGSRVLVRLDDATLGLLTTDLQGRFDGTVPVPLATTAGPHRITLRYDGRSGVEGTHRDGSVLVQVSSVLGVDDAHGAPNATVQVTGTLADVHGQGLPGQVVRVTADGQAPRSVVTSADGSFTAKVTVPARTPLGALGIAAEYAGSRNATYGPSTAQASVHVGSPSKFDLAEPRLERGANHLVGRLVQAADGVGIPGARIATNATGLADGETTTDGEGRFEVPLPIRPSRPGGAVEVRLDYAGGDGHGAQSAEAHLVFRPSTELAVKAPGEAGRGVALLVPVRLSDDGGNPVQGPVEATFLGVRANATTDADGRAELRLDVPSGATSGSAQITVRYPGDAHHHATQLSRGLAVKDGARLSLDAPARVDPGDRVTVRVHLEDQDARALPGELVAIRVEGQPAALLARTDSNGDAVAHVTAPASGQFALSALYAGSDAKAGTQAGAELAVRSLAPPRDPVWPLATGVVLLALAAVGGAWLVVRWRRRPTAQLERALLRTEARIRAGDPWAGLVVLAYQALAEHLEARGLRERPDQSVRDVVGGLVSATGIPEPTAVAFVRLVEQARYSGRPTAPGDARQARILLHSLVKALRQGSA